VESGQHARKALIQLSMAKGATPAAAADAFIDQYSAAVKRRDATTVHGFPAAVVESELTTQDGTLAVLAYFIKKDAQVFVMYGITTPDEYPGRGSQFTAVMTGFAPVTDPAVLGKKPRRLKIVSAPTSGTMASVLRALGAGDDMLSELAVLNGRAREAQVRSGELIKIVQ
jgi:predicted Zn-dependent protease